MGVLKTKTSNKDGLAALARKAAQSSINLYHFRRLGMWPIPFIVGAMPNGRARPYPDPIASAQVVPCQRIFQFQLH